MNVLREVATAVARFGHAPDPGSAARELLVTCVELVEGDRGRLYLFDLASGAFRSYCSVGRSTASTPVVHPRRAHGSRIAGPIEQSILSRAPLTVAQPSQFIDQMGRQGSYASRFIAPALRSPDTVVGIMDIDSLRDGSFSMPPTSIQSRISPLLALVPRLYDWHFTRTLMEGIQAPVAYDQSTAGFYAATEEYIAFASQMEYFVLREYDADADYLATLAQNGLRVDNREDLDLAQASTIRGFREALTSRTPFAATNMRDSDFAILRKMHSLDSVLSFVACPVMVGRELFGILSFGTSIEYDYSYDEIAGLKSIANAVGLSILNFRHFHKSREEAVSFQEIGTAITAVEVAQAARHEARNVSSTITESVLLCRRLMLAKPSKNAAILEVLESINHQAITLDEIMEKIKSASRAPSQDKSLVSLGSIWDEARKQLSGRLSVARVDNIEWQGPNPEVQVAPDWFRQVFINLILNSCDAFTEGSGPKQRRRIQLLVDKLEERSNVINFRYADNAGGINLSALRRVDGAPIAGSFEEALFLPDITSKRNGSGWGLYIVRRVLKFHCGSIRLIEHRNNTVFEITIPKPS